MAAVMEAGSARAALVERLQHALDALEQGDEAGWPANWRRRWASCRRPTVPAISTTPARAWITWSR